MLCSERLTAAGSNTPDVIPTDTKFRDRHGASQPLRTKLVLALYSYAITLASSSTHTSLFTQRIRAAIETATCAAFGVWAFDQVLCRLQESMQLATIRSTAQSLGCPIDLSYVLCKTRAKRTFCTMSINRKMYLYAKYSTHLCDVPQATAPTSTSKLRQNGTHTCADSNVHCDEPYQDGTALPPWCRSWSNIATCHPADGASSLRSYCCALGLRYTWAAVQDQTFEITIMENIAHRNKLHEGLCFR